MFKPKFNITPKINKTLIEIERVRGFLDAVKLNDDWISEMQQNVLILESHHSTHIEGTQLTIEQSKNILEGKNIAGIDKDDKLEVLNYKKAMVFISKYLGKDNPITEGVIRELHKLIVINVRGGKLEPGKYRNKQNYIINSITKKVIYTPPTPQDVPHFMFDFVKWINSTTDMSPILIAGISQFQFVHIHPFIDGNGRTARLLSTLILYKTGYDFKKLFTISEYYDKNRTAYYKAIQSVRKNKMDMTEWLEYFVNGLKTQMKEIYEKGKLVVISENNFQLFKEYKLNKRQEKIIKYLMTNEQINNAKCQNICNCIKRTATRDLSGLIEKRILNRIGLKKGSFYILDSKVKNKIRDNKGHQ